MLYIFSYDLNCLQHFLNIDLNIEWPQDWYDIVKDWEIHGLRFDLRVNITKSKAISHIFYIIFINNCGPTKIVIFHLVIHFIVISCILLLNHYNPNSSPSPVLTLLDKHECGWAYCLSPSISINNSGFLASFSSDLLQYIRIGIFNLCFCMASINIRNSLTTIGKRSSSDESITKMSASIW